MTGRLTKRCPSPLHEGDRELPLDDFHRQANKKDGRKSWCKKCVTARYRLDPSKQKERSRRWMERNKDRVNTERRERYWADEEYRQTCLTVMSRWGKLNRNKTNANVRRWKQRHPERARLQERLVNARQKDNQRKWRLRNPERIAASRKKWNDNNRAYIRAHRLIRRAKGTQTNLNKQKFQQRWDYYGGKCWLCGNEAVEMDHVKPISRGGCSLAANLRPACRSCNRRKGNLWPLNLVLEKLAS